MELAGKGDFSYFRASSIMKNMQILHGKQRYIPTCLGNYKDDFTIKEVLYMHTMQHGMQQLNQCRMMAQQLIQQTQQANQMYRQMMQNEQQNAMMLEQMAQRERQAVQTIQQSLQGHEMAIQRCQQIIAMCNQMEQQLASPSQPMMPMTAMTPMQGGFHQQFQH